MAARAARAAAPDSAACPRWTSTTSARPCRPARPCWRPWGSEAARRRPTMTLETEMRNATPATASPFNFAEHLFALHRQRGDRLAYIDDRGPLSYGQLEQRARRLAGALQAAGIRREGRVLLLMLDTHDWPV